MTRDEFVADLLDAEAATRETLHAGHASSRPLSEDYELIGMAGEFEFGRQTGLMPDLSPRPGGDAGVDFTLPLQFTVDVKTAREPYNLLHEQGKPFADIYVLAQFDEYTRRATLIGWEFGMRLRLAPTRDFGHGIVSHFIHRSKLRPMSELIARVKR